MKVTEILKNVVHNEYLGVVIAKKTDKDSHEVSVYKCNPFIDPSYYYEDTGAETASLQDLEKEWERYKVIDISVTFKYMRVCLYIEVAEL